MKMDGWKKLWTKASEPVSHDDSALFHQLRIIIQGTDEEELEYDGLESRSCNHLVGSVRDFPESFEVMAGGNLSDHDQHAIVSVLECSAGVMLSVVLNRLLRFCSLHRGSG